MVSKKGKTKGNQCTGGCPANRTSYKKESWKSVKYDKAPSKHIIESNIKLQMIMRDSELTKAPGIMLPSNALKEIDWNATTLQPLSIKCPLDENSGGLVEARGEVSGKEMIMHHSKGYGSIAYVIRRPGCPNCRIQALHLRVLALMYPSALKGFGLFGIVKEVGVDDIGLAEFYEHYFPYPLYVNEDRSYYNALGNRCMGVTEMLRALNPCSKVSKTIRGSGIQGNSLGEGKVLGGIIIFDADGKPKYMYEEDSAGELPVGDIITCLESIRSNI